MNIDKRQIAELVVKIQNGDDKAFENLYNFTYQAAYYTAVKILKDEDSAEDVLQESYIKILGKIKTIEKPESFMSWFNMIVANESKNFLRKTRPDFFAVFENDEGEEYSAAELIEDDSEEFKPGAEFEKDELQKTVMSFIDSLSDEKRSVIILSYYNDMPIKEIAASLNISEGTVKSRLFNAKKELADKISTYEKKHGKLLGVAIVPIIKWALKYNSATVAAALAKSGVAAAIFSSITAKAVITGGIITKIAGLSLVQKVVAGIAAVTVIAGTSVGAVAVTKAIENKKAELQATISDNSYENYPSKKFDLSKSGSNTEKSEDLALSEEMDEAKAEKKFCEFLELYYDWIDPRRLGNEFTDESTSVQVEWGDTAYLIDRNGFNSIADIKEAFLEYCSPEVYETMHPFWEYKEMNNRLYYVSFACSPYYVDYNIDGIKKISDDKYRITTISCGYQPGSLDVEKTEWYYMRQDDGKWLISEVENTYIGDLLGRNVQGGAYYTVSTKGSPLNIRERPTTDSEVIGSVPNGTTVYVAVTCNGWALIYDGNDNLCSEWINTDYLKQ